jgi:hypothetical protein
VTTVVAQFARLELALLVEFFGPCDAVAEVSTIILSCPLKKAMRDWKRIGMVQKEVAYVRASFWPQTRHTIRDCEELTHFIRSVMRG